MNYLEVLSTKFPGVEAYAVGTNYTYEDIIWSSDIISKEDLDGAWSEIIVREKQDEVNRYRDIFLDDLGFYFQGNLFDCDTLAKANVTGAITSVIVGMTLPGNFSWRSLENTNIPMNAPTLTAFGLSMSAYVSTIFQWSWTVKAKLDQISDIEQIKTFDPINYWPNNNYDGSGPGGVTTSQSLQAAYIALMTDYP